MFLVALLWVLVKLAFSISYPEFNGRFNVVIDLCINNVTIDGSDNYQNSGSMICRCGTYNVMCFAYEENDCSGNVANTVSWGGCDQEDSSERFFYNITGCATAQANAVDGGCTYFVEDGGWTGNDVSEYASVIKPMGSCQDYNCGSSNDASSRSCRYTNNAENITYTIYSDYVCNSGPTIDNRDYDYSQRTSGTSYVDCGVTVTRYDIDDSDYNCGSKDSKIKVSTKSTPSKNYMLEDINNIPQSIGACLSRRDGYHKYSWKYECNDDGDMVYKRIYLDSDGCSGTSYISQNYSSLNYTIVCDQGKGEGKYGYYGNGCDEQNWDASFYEIPKLYDECIPFRDNPMDTASDGSLYQDVPWQSNLRVVHSCVKISGWLYEAHYFFATNDCSGDYLFAVDENGEYADYENYKRYPCRRTQRRKISNCGTSVGINRKGKLYLD